MAKRSVLLIEDDSELRRLYRTIFAKDGFVVYEAQDGQNAIDQAVSTRPSAIILDLLLPRQGGLHVLKILRSLPETRETPIFVLTALPNPEYQQEASNKVQGYFLKTQINPQQLVEKVKEFLRDDS